MYAEPRSIWAWARTSGRSSWSASVDGAIGPGGGGLEVVAQHVHLGEDGKRLRLLDAFVELVRPASPSAAVLCAVGRRVADVVIEAADQAQRGRFGFQVTGPFRSLEAPDGQVARVGEETVHPGGAAGQIEELRVVAGFGQPELGQLQRLVGRAGMERPARPFSRGLDHVVELARAVGVVGDRGEVVAAHVAQRIERGLVQAAPLAPEEVRLDRFAGEGMAEREGVGLGLDEQAARHEVAQDPDELVLRPPGDRGQDVEARRG